MHCEIFSKVICDRPLVKACVKIKRIEKVCCGNMLVAFDTSTKYDCLANAAIRFYYFSAICEFYVKG